jgi:ParB/RepB/Spo0J family partition protein
MPKKATGPKPTTYSSKAEEMANIPKPSFKKMDISQIKVEPGYNFRKDASPGKELINSVKEYGVLEPILVRTSDFRTGRVSIVDGHRRFNAALEAGLKTIPTMHYPALSEDQAMALSFTGTDDAKPLTRQERCDAFARLQKKGWTEKEMVHLMGRDLKTVREYLAVLGAVPAIQAGAAKELKDGGIDARSAARASKLPKEVQERIAPELVGKPRAEASKIVQHATIDAGVVRPGRKPLFGPKATPAPAGPAAPYKVAADFQFRLQEIERRTQLKINAGKGVRASLDYVMLVIKCLKGYINIDDIDDWKGIK